MSNDQMIDIAGAIFNGERDVEELDDMNISSDERAYILHLVDKFEEEAYEEYDEEDEDVEIVDEEEEDDEDE